MGNYCDSNAIRHKIYAIWYIYNSGGNLLMHFYKTWSELRENEMSVVDLERKSIAAMKTGAPRALLSVGRFIPTGQGHNSSLVRSPLL